MILPDGTELEVIELTNVTGVVSGTLRVKLPDLRVFYVWVEAEPMLRTACGNLSASQLAAGKPAEPPA